MALTAWADDGKSSKIVYGYDSRKDVYEETDAPIRRRAQLSAVVLMDHGSLSCSSVTGECTPTARSLGQSRSLCNGEKFADQPTAGFCSGTLISPNHVLTAGHCITSDKDCANMRLVFNYMYSGTSAQLDTIVESTDVYMCRTYLSDMLEDGTDWAIIQLDRSPVANGKVAAKVAPQCTWPVLNSGTTACPLPVWRFHAGPLPLLLPLPPHVHDRVCASLHIAISSSSHNSHRSLAVP